jgi:two-component system chemotaxis sensor kinase CheA
MTSSIDISQFFEVFFDESEELLAEMESLLMAIDIRAPSKEECDAIFRTAHSIKGGAATFGLTDMVEMTHVIESLLDKVRQGEMKLTEGHVSVFLQAKDMLERQLKGHQQKKPIDSELAKDVMALLRDLQNQGAGAMESTEPFAVSAPQTKPKEGLGVADGAYCFNIELPMICAEDYNALTAELRLMGNLACDTLRDGRTVLKLVTTEKLDDVVSICSFLLNPKDIHITEVVVQPEASRMTKCLPPWQDDHQDSKHIRVNLDKVDQLLNRVGELVITQAMIEQHAGRIDAINHEQLLNHFATLARNTRNLQESVMSIRMIPMDLVFSRFPRMVRELAGKLGKKAKLITLGGGTELDKGLMERICDPLTHLVRNSIDHGLEEPTVRLANNKSETGTITLSAFQESGNIVLQVSDDGMGIDRIRIISKARELGIQVSDEMTDEEVWKIIFTPGFTTAKNLTDISGRGIGMDIVQRNISALGGHVDIRSSLGQGTTVVITLPLTLAILEGMIIRIDEELYILPLLAVVESLMLVPGQIQEITGKGRVVRVRGKYIPLILLHELFGIQCQPANFLEGIVVVVEALGMKAALLVDNLEGQQQIVVKTLETNYRRIPGVSGATILGDGNVSLILDVASLLKHHQ